MSVIEIILEAFAFEVIDVVMIFDLISLIGISIRRFKDLIYSISLEHFYFILIPILLKKIIFSSLQEGFIYVS